MWTILSIKHNSKFYYSEYALIFFSPVFSYSFENEFSMSSVIHWLPLSKLNSVNAWLVVIQRKKIKEKNTRERQKEKQRSTIFVYVCLLLSWSEQPNKHKSCLKLSISDVSSVTLNAFLLLVHIRDVRPMYCCHDIHSMNAFGFFSFFFWFWSLLPSSSDNAHIHNTLFIHIHFIYSFFSIFLDFSFLSFCYLKGRDWVLYSFIICCRRTHSLVVAVVTEFFSTHYISYSKKNSK